MTHTEDCSVGPVLMCLAVTVSDSHRGLQCGASVEDVFSSDRRLTPRTAVWRQC